MDPAPTYNGKADDELKERRRVDLRVEKIVSSLLWPTTGTFHRKPETPSKLWRNVRWPRVDLKIDSLLSQYETLNSF